MRIALLIVLVVLLLWSIIDPILRLNHRPSQFWVWLLTAVISVTLVTEIRWQVYEGKATDIVQTISGEKESRADCQRVSEAFFDAQIRTFGFVDFKERSRAHISYSTCSEFMSFLDSAKTDASSTQVRSVAVIIHEAYHVQGIDGEATTECHTRKKLKSVLIDLGVAEEKAKEYASRYTEESKANLNSEYQNGRC